MARLSEEVSIENRAVILVPEPGKAGSALYPYITALLVETSPEFSARYRFHAAAPGSSVPQAILQIVFIEAVTASASFWSSRALAPPLQVGVRTLQFLKGREETAGAAVTKESRPLTFLLPESPSLFAAKLAEALVAWDGVSAVPLSPEVFRQPRVEFFDNLGRDRKPAETARRRLAKVKAKGKTEASEAKQDATGAIEETRRESFLPEAESDQPTAKDHLGFTPYVQGLARFLAAEGTKPPLTVSVEGEWGSGKSSFMLQLRGALEAEPALKDRKGRVFSVWFNPWRHDRGESMWAAFALHFIRELEAELSWWERLQARVALAWNRRMGGEATLGHVGRAVGWVTAGLLLSLGVGVGTFLGLQYALGSQPATWTLLGSALAAPAAGLAAFAQWAAGAVRKVRQRLEKEMRSPDYAGRAAFIEEFHEDFRRIVAAYAGVAAGQGPKPRVFVFVDDLDRCDVPRAAELMQAINLLIADDPRIVFLLGMDRQKVAAGIAVRHRDLLPFLFPDTGAPRPNGLRYGYSFIEKFIQIQFALPTPTKDEVALLLRRGQAETAAPQPQSQSEPQAGPSPANTQAANGAKGAPAQQSPAAKPEPAVQQRRRLIEVTFDTDSDAVRDLALRLAPSFGSNPRRIKQFVNLFRLRGYIATSTGLFDLAAGQDPAEALTLEQFGKFVALSLRFPLVAEALAADPGLLAALQEAATQPAAAKAAKDPRAKAVEAWRTAEPGLLDLLAVGLGGPASGRYDMRRVDAAKLMRVSPALPAASTAGPGTSPSADRSRALEVYRSQLEFVLRNGPVGLPQEEMLRKMREALRIPEQEADELRRLLERSLLRTAA